MPFFAESAGVGGAMNSWEKPLGEGTELRLNHLRWLKDVKYSGVLLDLSKHWRLGFLAVNVVDMELRNDVPTSDPLGIFDNHFNLVSTLN